MYIHVRGGITVNISNINRNNADYRFLGQNTENLAFKKPVAVSYDQRSESKRFDSFSSEESIQKFKSYYSEQKNKNKVDNANSAKNENAADSERTRYTKRPTYILGDIGNTKLVNKGISPEMSVLSRLTSSAGGYTLCKTNGDGGFSYSIKTGKKSVITIDSRFLEAIADSPELIKHYANEIENMRRLDKQFERQAKRAGKTVVSRGWHIDKDGGISSWSVVKTESKAKKSHLQQMNEYRQKINKKKKQKQKEQQKIDERRSKRKEELLRLEGRKKAAMKERLGRKAKKAKLYEFNEIIIKRPPQTIKSISISSGYAPPIADLSKLNIKA